MDNTYTYDNIDYILLQDPYHATDGSATYVATAVRAADIDIDADERDVYEMTWDVICPLSSEQDDESIVCDWDNPASVRKL